MLKIVLDSNIYISAAVFGGKPKTLFEFITKNSFFLLFVSNEIKTEVIEALQIKFGFTVEEINIFLNLAWSNARYLDPKIDVNFSRDPKDNHILALAIEAKADFILTGDKDLLVLDKINNIPIVTPSDFLVNELWK